MRTITHHVRGAVVGYLALFFALTGGAYAATQIITSSDQVADNVILTNHIKDGTIQAADLSQDATHTFGYSGTYTFTETSCSSGTLVCEWRNTNGTGNGIDPNEGKSQSTVAVFKDLAGVVHLRGQVCYAPRYSYATAGSGVCASSIDAASETSSIVTLPSGYRPPQNEVFPQTGGGDVIVTSGGHVLATFGHDLSLPLATLDGISFRTS